MSATEPIKDPKTFSMVLGGIDPVYANHVSASVQMDGVFIDFRVIAPLVVGKPDGPGQMEVDLRDIEPHTRIFLTYQSALVFFNSVVPLVDSIKEAITELSASGKP